MFEWVYSKNKKFHEKRVHIDSKFMESMEILAKHYTRHDGMLLMLLISQIAIINVGLFNVRTLVVKCNIKGSDKRNERWDEWKSKEKKKKTEHNKHAILWM